MRMVLEVVMLLTLVGGLFFAMKVLSKENKLEKTLSENDGEDGALKSTHAEPDK